MGDRPNTDGSQPAAAESTILLALADGDIAAAFERALEAYPGGTVSQISADSTTAVSYCVERRPVAAIVGADLTPLDGYATTKEIVSRASGVSVLLVARDPTSEDFRKALRAGARDMLPVPVDKSDLFSALDAAIEVSRAKRITLDQLTAHAVDPDEIPKAKRIVVFSTKGGTGKTFVATNLAVGLAAAGSRVALVDLDLQFGDVAIALGMTPDRTLFDLVQTYTQFDLPLMRDFMLKHPSGLHVLPAPLYPDQADQITTSDIESLLSAIETGYDYVVVDTPPFFEDRILVALDWADYVLLIGSLDLPSVKNMKISFTTMDLMAYPEEKLRIVINRADTKVGLDIGEVEKTLGRKVELAISSSIDVPRALNAGEALVLTKPGSKVSKELAKLVQAFKSAPTLDQSRLARWRKR
jgi:pilus assembly protein CpaE